MDLKNNRIVLSDLVKMDFPLSVLDEVKTTICMVDIDFDLPWLDKTFRDLVKLYNGEYPGYKRCNTRYHDLKHTTDVFLSLARLIHGAHVAGVSFRKEHVTLALISALFHDSGYLQETGDDQGTGAKHTLVRTERSIKFIQGYLSQNNYPPGYFQICMEMIRCTDHYEKISAIPFTSKGVETLGKMLGTADILGQLADRIYLEKLLYLFQEVSEVEILGYRNELDLMRKTLDFYRDAKQVLVNELDRMGVYMAYHFRERWGINVDMYQDSIDANMNYLQELITNHEDNYRSKLQRGGIVAQLSRPINR